MLNISFLGKFKIEYKEQDITDKIGVKTSALIALLILQEKREVSREKVIAYLWPDSNEDAAKYNLRYNLWLLKKVIPLDDNGESFLRINKEFCGINFNYNFQCDILNVVEFCSDKEYSVKELIYLKDSFKGDFFEGNYFNNCDEFNEIIIFQRNKLENHRIKILRKLVEFYEINEIFDKCIETINEIFNIDPYDENLALKAISIYLDNGNRYGAIKFYQDFSNKMIYSLGIHPSQGLQEKYNQIRNESCGHDEGESHGAINYKSIITENKNKENITLKIQGIKSVNYFGISEIIEGLIEKGVIDAKISVESEYLEDLSYISQHLAKHCNLDFDRKIVVPEVRVVQGLFTLMNNISKEYIVEIEVKDMDNMDSCSKEMLSYLESVEVVTIY
ncbi:MAG: BTAD domain-containing putative transcriptional regulator [Clostridium sp.]